MNKNFTHGNLGKLFILGNDCTWHKSKQVAQVHTPISKNRRKEIEKMRA